MRQTVRTKGAVLDLEGLIEHLYDLNPEELRRLAWEALLISDGLDSIEQGNQNPRCGMALAHLKAWRRGES